MVVLNVYQSGCDHVVRDPGINIGCSLYVGDYPGVSSDLLCCSKHFGTNCQII